MQRLVAGVLLSPHICTISIYMMLLLDINLRGKMASTVVSSTVAVTKNTRKEACVSTAVHLSWAYLTTVIANEF